MREYLEVVGIPLYPVIHWKLISPKFLINLECMSREKTFRHVIVQKIMAGLLSNLVTGKTALRFFVSRKTSNFGPD